jgi:hypothetical protein
MPIREKQIRAKELLTDLQWDFLRGETLPDTFDAHLSKYDSNGTNAELWAAHRDVVLNEHARKWPGTRPELFWKYDAPEPRKRLGGTGTVASDVLNIKPSFSDGLPNAFIDQSDVDYYNREGLFAHVAPNPNSTGPFKGVAIDSEDPPKYESEASYLDRHGLFLPGEKKQLKKADFEPETLAYVE